MTAVVCFNDEIIIVLGNPDIATRIIAVDVSGSVNTIVQQIREALGSFLIEDNHTNAELTLPKPRGRTAIVDVMKTYAKPGVELVIITDGEENCYHGELNGKPFRPGADDAPKQLADYAASLSDTKFVLLGIGQGAEKTTSAWMHLPNAFVGHITEKSTIRDTKAVVSVLRSKSRRNKKINVVVTPSNIRVQELTDAQRKEYTQVVSKVKVQGHECKAELTGEDQDMTKEQLVQMLGGDDIVAKLAVHFMAQASDQFKAPKNYIGRYGKWDNEGRKSQVNSLLSQLARKKVLERKNVDKTPHYKLLPKARVAVKDAAADYDPPATKTKKRKRTTGNTGNTGNDANNDTGNTASDTGSDTGNTGSNTGMTNQVSQVVSSKKRKTAVEYHRFDGDTGGSFHDVFVTVSPKKLQQLFGKPGAGDGGRKVHGSIKIKATNGQTFSVYDWCTGINPWLSDEPHAFHIGCNGNQVDDAKRFATWLEEKCGTPKAKHMDLNDDIQFLMHLYDTNPEVQQLADGPLGRSLGSLGSLGPRGPLGPLDARNLFEKRCKQDESWRNILINVCKTQYESFRRGF